MKRLTERDEYGNADIIALSDVMPEIYASLSFSEANALTEALNRLADYEDSGVLSDNEWIECRKKIPENGKSVLIAIKNNRYSWIDIGYIDGDGYWTVDGEPWDRESDPAITHWMPTPEPPKED